MQRDMTYLAHSSNSGKEEPLHAHLELVAKRASSFAEDLNLASEANIAGLLHDLGKYGDLFQRRLAGQESGIDHWSAGAMISLEKYTGKICIVPVANAILGHHIGLQNLNPRQWQGESKLREEHPRGLRLSDPDFNKLLHRFQADSLTLPEIAPAIPWNNKFSIASMLDVRMLFSTLVDADFIETEAFFQEKYRPEGHALRPESVLPVLTSYLKKLSAGSGASPEINQVRHDLLNVCLAAGKQPQGLFTLTAPTGTGKTLAMLAFALQHAMEHGLRRIVLVIPYLNIIEQSGLDYRTALDSFVNNEDSVPFILEDHSLAGTRFTDKEAQSDMLSSHGALLAENWDAPITVTTSVQFFESLFANRPSACRKLHRLAKSVILFDEVQTLPVNLAVPTLAALSHLAGRYQSSVVFATATQPAFNKLNDAVQKQCIAGWSPEEIVPQELDLFSRCRRIQVEWPAVNTSISWCELAAKLRDHPQTLCIVNLKRHALQIFQELAHQQGVFHMSTNMCSAHRRVVLNEVRRRLKNESNCLLISTQCVEAGVDIDFPAVFRAIGPLDAIAQAAGRCNRHGTAPFGNVHVFRPEDTKYPDGAYQQAATVTEMLLKEHSMGIDINDPQIYREYYERLYAFIDPEKSKPELQDAILRQDFADVARLYRVISQDTINVLVSYNKAVFTELKAIVTADGLTAQWIRRARPYAIGLYRPKPHDPVTPFIKPVSICNGTDSTEWYIYLKEDDYDEKVGLILPISSNVLIA